MKKINHLDLFSGIGGFHLGFERAGFKINSFFSEIDKHAIAVYKHKFPKSTYVGSVTNVQGGDLPRIDLITFGSPCQDFSLAGKRAGMGGDRSSLILEAIRLIGECRPRVFIWENVKGTFSSNAGEDFAAIIQEFANIGGYRLEWQLLNTSWFLPQNRERIYLVGYSTTPKRGWRGVFPIREKSTEGYGLSGQQANTNTILQRYGNDTRGSYIIERKLDAQAVVEPMIYDGYNNKVKEDNIVGTITQHCSRSGMTNGFKVIEPMIGIGIYGNNKESQYQKEVTRALALKASNQTNPRSGGTTLVGNQYRIRRLTPIECERLQGFPDDHTSLGNYDGETKPMSNTQRYKQCGNAVTVDVVEAVAKKCIPLF